MPKRLCKVCRVEIPRARLKVLPETLTCVLHSDATKTEGIMEFGHKTAPGLVILPKDKEAKRKALRAFRRAR